MNPVTVIGVAALAVVSITSHEAAHGFMADRLGDPTARERGRLTLNPIPHIDPFFTVLLPLFLILAGSSFIVGGAKPVPVDVSRLRNPRRDWALVGAAGPGVNVLIAIGLTIVLSAATVLGLADPSSTLTEVLAVGIFLNALLAVFNLIPIPPLDGSRVVQYFLSAEALTLYRRLERFGLLIILALVLFVPQLQAPLSLAIFGLVRLITAPFGASADVEAVLRRLFFG
jgi:Zn-dependent protease